MTSVTVAGFSAHRGLAFPNNWPHTPDIDIELGKLGSLPIGDAANGLCGGMSYTAGDLFLARLPAPPGEANPLPHTAKYDYIVSRQLDSLAFGTVPLRFWSLMQPDRPAEESRLAAFLGMIGIDRHSLHYVMVNDELPKLRAAVDAGQIAMLGLVRTISSQLSELGHHHQVAAFGYELEGPRLVIQLYDPNWPGESVQLSLDINDPRSRPIYSKLDGPVYGFFVTPYSPRDPAPWR